MSSATSIEHDLDVRAAGTPEGGAGSPQSAPRRDTLQPWHFFVLVSLLTATVAVILARNSRPEHLVLISLTIGAAGFAAGALYRTLVPLVGKDSLTVETPVDPGRRAELEREKLLILRAIKELEFDRAMGKVSGRDFDEMSGRLRARAMAIMRGLDAGGAAYRELIERELTARLCRPGPARTSPGRQPAARRAGAAAPGACPCGTRNDPDAAFCKRCGMKLEPATRS